MKVLHHDLGTIYVPQQYDSLRGLLDLSGNRRGGWAADTETIGLGIYKKGYRVRMVQVGTRDEAWLLNPDWAEHRAVIQMMTTIPGTRWHNFVFDALSMEQDERLHIDASETMAAADDTEILSRLLDPRGPEHGGVGHSLKGLSEHYLKLPVGDARAVLLKHCKAMKYRDPSGKIVTSSTMWEHVPYDDEVYQLYAGQDVFLANRLAEVLEPLVQKRGLTKFREFEMGLAVKCAQMQRIGTKFDADYAMDTREHYDELVEAGEESLAAWGVEPGPKGTRHSVVNEHVRVLKELGHDFDTWTPKGKESLTKEVLNELSERDDKVGDFARTVRETKHAAHFRDYMDQMLVLAGKDGRIHPDIRPLRAATARMSISNPALQQIPPDVRGALVADDGEVLIAADYAQIEWRIAAAVSRDPVMVRKILNGEDLHAPTATAVYGPDFTKAQRSECKRVGFGRMYLGSVKGITLQTGLPKALVRKASRGFDHDYAAFIKWGRGVQERIKAGDTTVVTATGRPLICTKPWAAVNYSIQSPARDVFATGIINLHRKGLGDRLRLVIHDEVILSVPKDEAEHYCREVEGCMNTTFRGIPIVTEAEVIGERWRKI